ncbi:hypothetical protein HHX38_02855 [Streptomyces sp. PKU-MA01144]|uniref:hypothetical protein n=1 Tax=Streptomyces sp. PKU-MA01144 TaxID=2729138 RepID=UPI00148119B1|nr:hypothetical protein [Streptomyces sp. PKU-MA01144]NNJ03086.1 hypothetical protein [Streptomyces sp. PKU-MA01144]
MSSDQQNPYGAHDPYGQNPPDPQVTQAWQNPPDPQAAQAWQNPPDPQAARTWQNPPDPQVTQAWQSPRDAHVAQTWEGQTWDTQYQPVVGDAPHPPYPQGGRYTGAADTAYLPPVGAPHVTAHPLPPEAPDTSAAYGPQGASYVPPVVESDPVGSPAGGELAYGAPSTGGEPAYGAPTTRGNSRVTDAQRARAEGRSPIIAPGVQSAGLTALLGLLLAATAGVSPYLLLVPLIALQGLTAAGWFRLNGMWPARQGIALAFAGGLVADAVLLGAGREHAAAALVGTLGVWVLLTLVLQLRSRASADERMHGLMATIASAALTIVAAGFLAAAPEAVAAGGAAVAAAALARALPLPGAASALVALLTAVGAGIAAGAVTGVGAEAVLPALGAGVCALVGLRVASYDYPSRFVHMTAGVALPLTAAAPIVYLLGRVVG